MLSSTKSRKAGKNLFNKLFLLITALIMSNSSLLAQYEWEEWPTNPLAIHGSAGSWDESVITPCVIFNSDLNRYEMWFGTFDGTYPNNGIGFAWSTDGIIWTKHPTPVMTPDGTGWDAVSVGECSVIKEGNVYKMWYTGHPNSTRTPSYIGYATSTDGGLTWEPYADNPVLSPGTGWESARVEFPSVTKVTGGYWMFYTGELAHSIARTGRAFSTDGINWQKDTVNNPVLLPGDPGEWDQNNYLGNVIELNNTLYIYYTANPGVGGTAIGGAVSTDMGITWSKFQNNPIILQGTTGQWDDGWIETGCAVFARNELRLYYDGGSPSTGWLGRIGFATSEYSIDTLYVPQEYPTIQAAINAAVDGNLVLVDEGTYLENINFKGKAITVASNFFIDGDETHIANTIIDGSQPSHPDSGSVVTFNSGEDTTSILVGFTITGGTGTVIGTLNAKMGGGICVFYSGTTIKNNIIELNTMAYNDNAYGGGIGANSHNVDHYIIENNLIQNNSINTPSVTDYSLGGGIYTMTDGSVRIANNKIIDNTITAPTAYGGGMEPTYFNDADYSILNNYVSSNIITATDGFGGGIDVYSFSPLIKNNIIVNNSAPKGGGIFIEDGIPVLSNNTIASNTATTSGGGLEVVGLEPEVMNCIIWSNSATTGSQINGTADVSYSDIEGGYTGTGNIDMDPLFRDASNGDFHLQSTDCGYSFNSPCIDAGNPAYEDWPLSCDWGLGQVRSDMGAFGGTNLVVDVPEEDVVLPNDYCLYQNYPNPFNPTTTFRYSIPTQSKVVIKVFDILGNEIATLIDEEKSIGTYELTWSAANLTSGVYFYQLKAGNFIETKKMILLK